MKKKIFISSSGYIGEELAHALKDSIDTIFGDYIDVHVASRARYAGAFQEQLEDELLAADMMIVLFTPHDRELRAHWKMYEVGMFKAAAKARGINSPYIINYSFCSTPKELADIGAPVQDINSFMYTYQNQTNKSDYNLTIERHFQDMMDCIRKNLDIKDVTSSSLIRQLKDLWRDELYDRLDKLADKAIDIRNAGKISQDKMGLTDSNKHLDGSVFATKKQLMYSNPIGDDTKYTPKSLEEYFETILKFFIPSDCQQDPIKNLDGTVAHTVRLGRTRISTFVAFTDGENILLFDRARANPNQKNVENNRYDVFGSVQFENRTIKMKIPSEAFLNAPIEKLSPIYGAAFEDNHSRASYDQQEVAVMFGVFAHMSKEDLRLALEVNGNGALFIAPVAVVNSMTSDKFTSKAYLSIKQLSDLPVK